MEELLKSGNLQELMASLMTPENQSKSFNEAAQKLEKAEKNGQPAPRVDFSVFDRCANCHKEIYPPNKSLRCSACKAVIYCSKSCATRDWNQAPARNHPTHKQLCPYNKRHMEHVSKAQAVIKSFPWGRLETDNTFCFELAKARFKILGETGNGFWSVRGGPVAHQNQGDGPKNYSALTKQIAARFSHLDGYDLIHFKDHLTDAEGWKLSPELIPYRDMAQVPDKRRPVLVTDFEGGIKDWDSWYAWRKLPKQSPAALLLSFPLSVYQLLVNTLDVTTPSSGKPDSRVPLCVHLLGPELELNFIPLFSELALLLPYHDITLVMFGPSVAKLMEAAVAEGVDDSPLRRSVEGKMPIFKYDAPDDLGSGSIQVMLHPFATWDRAELEHLQTDHPDRLPDAIVALNAGLASYSSWLGVIGTAYERNIPFGVTEYAEQSLEHAVGQHIPAATRQPPGPLQEIAFNPFHRPGQRQLPTYKMPNLHNGFTLVVIPAHDD